MTDWPSGVFSWSEAVEAFGRPRVRRWIGAGVWRRLDHGLYASVDLTMDPRSLVAAVMRTAGSGLVAVLESAAILHGFGVLDRAPVQLAGGRHQTARSRPGVQIHGSKLDTADIVRVDGLATTTPERTAIDLARLRHPGDGLAAVDAALRARVCTEGSLAAELLRLSGHRGVIQARQLIRWGDAAAESAMESRTRARILAAGLPNPVVQWWVCDSSGRRIYRLDLAWPARRVGVEYDGAHHTDRARQRRDIERGAWLADLGWRILTITDVDVYQQHGRMVHRLGRLLDTPHRRQPGDHADSAVRYGVSRTLSA